MFFYQLSEHKEILVTRGGGAREAIHAQLILFQVQGMFLNLIISSQNTEQFHKKMIS